MIRWDRICAVIVGFCVGLAFAALVGEMGETIFSHGEPELLLFPGSVWWTFP